MNKQIGSNYLELRLLVGYLGEKSQFAWWPTAFFSPASDQFLAPVFTRTTWLAKYHGATEAARRNHDEHIGVGRVFHLFRLPEEMEHHIHGSLVKGEIVIDPTDLATKDAALRRLVEIAEGDVPAGEGPVKVGTTKSMLTLTGVKSLARHYADAFSNDVKTYPYFTT